MKPLLVLLANPAVRAIAKPLIGELFVWIRGRRPRPRWLDGVLADVPELGAPVAEAEMYARAAAKKR